MNDDQKQNLQNYIRQQLNAGQTPDDIHAQLTTAGWPADVLQQAFYAVQSSVLPTSMPPSSSISDQSASATEHVAPVASGRRKGRIRTGWELLKHSMTILNGNRYLLRYLVMTAVWFFAITIVFIALYLVFEKSLSDESNRDGLSALGYLFAAVDYLLVCFFINLYAAGLTANVFDIFRGQRKAYSDYMHIAWSKAGPIFIFSLIQATVGLFLHYIVERIRFVGWLLSWILGTMWSLGTMFVIPIIVNDEHPSGVRSVKDSVAFFKQTWGENITAKVGVNAPLALINLAVVGLFFLGIIGCVALKSYSLFIILLFLYIIVILALAVIGSFANSLVNISLYYFATQKQAPPAFSAELLNQVFVKKTKRGLFGLGKSKEVI